MSFATAQMLLMTTGYYAEHSKAYPRSRYNIRHRQTHALVYTLLTSAQLLQRAQQLNLAGQKQHTP